jgi:hypothetical protein
MNTNGIILSLAYPDTIVRMSDEWYLSLLRFIGIGKKNYIRAGHAGLVLINKETGVLEYYDFGRYIVPKSNGRVRGKETDNELNFPITAKIKNDEIKNLDEILKFLATNPKLTHGEGKLVASVCKSVDYKKAKSYINELQDLYFIRYSAFVKDASNCSRFVTDVLIASVTDERIRKKLQKSKWFTPSTVSNVILANTEGNTFKICEKGNISKFEGSKRSEILRCFIDKLKDYTPNLDGSLTPKLLDDIHPKAQWLSGIGAGAWFELHETNHDSEYIYRRVSPAGNIDVDDVFELKGNSFNFNEAFRFTHHTNCSFFHIEQNGLLHKFERKLCQLKLNTINSEQMVHLV